MLRLERFRPRERRLLAAATDGNGSLWIDLHSGPKERFVASKFRQQISESSSHTVRLPTPTNRSLLTASPRSSAEVRACTLALPSHRARNARIMVEEAQKLARHGENVFYPLPEVHPRQNVSQLQVKCKPFSELLWLYSASPRRRIKPLR